MQVHEKGRRAAVMAGKVAHEDIDNVVIKAQIRSHAHSLP